MTPTERAHATRTSRQPRHRGAVRVAGAVLWLAACSAWAAPITYSGSGAVVPLAPPAPDGSLPLQANGSYSFASLAGAWSLLSNFTFSTATGSGAGTFAFSQGGSSFSGSIATTTAPIAGGPGFEIAYTITGGTGAFAGATGAGNGVIRLASDLSSPPPYAYIEAGIMNVTPVPEPTSALLMLGGVAALLGRRLFKPA